MPARRPTPNCWPRSGARRSSTPSRRTTRARTWPPISRRAFGPEQQARELADPNGRFLIAEVRGETAGYAYLHQGPAPEGVGGQRPMEIVRIYARRGWIGKGVGARLMQVGLEAAAQAGCDVTWLGVWERNPRAIAFYQKWGFVEVGAQVFWLGADQQRDLVLARPVNAGQAGDEQGEVSGRTDP